MSSSRACSTSRADAPFDAAIFYESFHHCADHLAMLERLHGIVGPAGRVLFAAEPVAPMAYPWGPRLDGYSLWSTRTYGWLELGFDHGLLRRGAGPHGLDRHPTAGARGLAAGRRHRGDARAGRGPLALTGPACSSRWPHGRGGGPAVPSVGCLRGREKGDSMARRARRVLPRLAAAAAGVTLAAGALVASSSASSAGASPRVLLVGTFHGVTGQFGTIQAAVNAAQPGDWILVAPGDYHEVADAAGVTAAQADAGDYGGVLITTPRLHLRGMNRGTVIVDGTKAGAPHACDSAPQWQNFGPIGPSGAAEGRDGVVVWKADGVTIQNLTACNFLTGTGDSGNEIWWNGGDDSGTIGLTGYAGSYLTATSTYLRGEATRGRLRDLLVQRPRAGPLERDLRQQHERLGHLRGGVPRGLRHHDRPRLDGVQRPRLLGDQLRRRHRRRALRVRPQQGRVRHRHPVRRRRAGAAERRLSGHGQEPDHPHPLVLGVHGQRRLRQQQPERARERLRGPRADRDGHDHRRGG